MMTIHDKALCEVFSSSFSIQETIFTIKTKKKKYYVPYG